MTRNAGPQQYDCAEARIALGVYVLGAIDPAEEALVDAHLDDCDACQAEMAELADVPALLALVSTDEAMRVLEAGEAAGFAEVEVGETPGLTVVRAPQRAPASEDKRGSGEPAGSRERSEGTLCGAAGRADSNPGTPGGLGDWCLSPRIKQQRTAPAGRGAAGRR